MSHYEEVIIGSTSQMTEVKSKATRTVNSRIRIPAPYLPECPPPLHFLKVSLMDLQTCIGDNC